MNGDHRWNCINKKKKLMLDGLDMTGLYSHKFHIYHISSYQIQLNLLNPRGFSHLKNSLRWWCQTLDFLCVLFLMIETHVIGLKYAGVRRQILHVHMYINIYIYIHETIFTCIYIYILQNILNIHDIHCIAFTLNLKRSDTRLEAPDRTWWSLKV